MLWKNLTFVLLVSWLKSLGVAACSLFWLINRIIDLAVVIDATCISSLLQNFNHGIFNFSIIQLSHVQKRYAEDLNSCLKFLGC